MFIDGINPVLFEIGPFAVRYYGLAFVISAAVGYYFLRKHGLEEGVSEDNLIMLVLIAFLGLIAGARAAFVITNWSFFAARPEEIIRIDHGGLAFHGGLLGGVLSSWVYCRIKRLNLSSLLDFAVPGIALGVILVRIANIFNQEILGRETLLFAFDRQPAQIYGSLIGLALLLAHNYLARRRSYAPGTLFWYFVLFYSLLRGSIEETFRDNPLVLWGHVSESWGVGFFTVVHLFTPLLVLFAWWMIRNLNRADLGSIVR